jgi:hypothetical protein
MDELREKQMDKERDLTPDEIHALSARAVNQLIAEPFVSVFQEQNRDELDGEHDFLIYRRKSPRNSEKEFSVNAG